MGLVNSFINQIGRELGRDAYRTINSRQRGRLQQKIADAEEPIYTQVLNFELLADDEQTFRHLANLVEKAEHVDPEDFKWQELFNELDNKIDFCKANLTQKYQGPLEKLDVLNARNYKAIKAKHIAYIDAVISHFDDNETKLAERNLGIACLATLIGLRPSYMREQHIYTVINILYLAMLGLIFFLGITTYNNPKDFSGNLPIETSRDLAIVQSTGITTMGIAIFFYLLYLGRGVTKILTYKKEIQNNIQSKIKFEAYKFELLK
ncbi:MAG: hypothetical protein FJZ80_10225 [Bacteroidetes bacterium]|nr:hypothetical protein [Bacteroidota bacterium]MBM3425338.1 hypothetical protein [Bacteroidota bacterium]